MPFQLTLEDAAWYFQMDKRILRRWAEDDVKCQYSYYDGKDYWIVTKCFKKALQEHSVEKRKLGRRR